MYAFICKRCTKRLDVVLHYNMYRCGLVQLRINQNGHFDLCTTRPEHIWGAGLTSEDTGRWQYGRYIRRVATVDAATGRFLNFISRIYRTP